MFFSNDITILFETQIYLSFAGKGWDMNKTHIGGVAF